MQVAEERVVRPCRHIGALGNRLLWVPHERRDGRLDEREGHRAGGAVVLEGGVELLLLHARPAEGAQVVKELGPLGDVADVKDDGEGIRTTTIWRPGIAI